MSVTTDETWQQVIETSIRFKRMVYREGGMTPKSVTEDMLLQKFPSIDRGLAHSALNRIEYENLDSSVLRRWDEEPMCDEFRPFMEGVDVIWYRGDPFKQKADSQ